MSAPCRMWGLIALLLVVLRPHGSHWQGLGNSGHRTNSGAGWALISLVHSAGLNLSLKCETRQWMLYQSEMKSHQKSKN